MPKTPNPSACKKAIKLLEPYERLARKFGIHISANRLADLNRLRDTGTISSTDLPAKLRAESPGEFTDQSLAEIRVECGM